MERMNAGWRLAAENGMGADGLPSAELRAEPGLTLFETIERSALPAETTYVLARSALSFAMLNIYPYSSGHLMVLPKRAVPTMIDLSDEEYTDLWQLVRDGYRASTEAFRPDGMNIGVNEMTAGGASQPEHLHVHVVPRFDGDTSFLTSVADTRVLPMSLPDSWARLRAAWPEPIPSTR